ncbi:hypothetical protein HY640_04565 [Candidatus Woesearchaeota archaeon]|nr:hypothetical protein [Candidatus Woesearchaeota archaeon]
MNAKEKSKSKKAIALNALVSLALFAIVAFALLWFVDIFVTGSKMYAEGGLCKLSVYAMAQTKTPIKSDSPLITNLKCETQYIKVKSDGIYRYQDGTYKKNQLYRSYSKEPEHAINKAVADQIKQCWGYLGEGQLDPFGKYDGAGRCIICSQIEFDDETKQKYPNGFQNFEDYLQKNYVRDETGAEISYWDYLSGGAKGELDIGFDTEPQSVVFISMKPDDTWKVASLAGLGIFVADGCTNFPAAAAAAGSLLSKIPIPGPAKALAVIGPILRGARIAGVATRRAGVGFAGLCKKPVLSKALKTGFFFGGAYTFVEFGTDEVEHKILGVNVMPSKDVGKACEKLYG